MFNDRFGILLFLLSTVLPFDIFYRAIAEVVRPELLKDNISLLSPGNTDLRSCVIHRRVRVVSYNLVSNRTRGFIQPRISNEPGKGQGVRAVGIGYKKGQILGELLGEFVPFDTFSDGWCMEFRRPDLGDEPIAQIYTKKMGNWVRKVTHSCDPSAEFKVMQISKMWRQMIVAITDISHDEEITAFCGTNFLRGQGKTCVCSACSR
ncbi:SET domain-containing protein [Cadophora sp. DSE1049]|nr:SET domain-containing protein [Cadophora sp. DSE1049]